MRRESKQVLLIQIPLGLATAAILWMLIGEFWIWTGVMALITVLNFLSGAYEASTKHAEITQLYAAVREIVEETQRITARYEVAIKALADNGINIDDLPPK